MNLNKKSIFFAIIYLALIPIFAFLFYLQSDKFYHSTIKVERNFITEQSKILTSLQEIMINNFISVHKDTMLKSGLFSIKDVELYNLSYSEGYYYFDLMADLNGRQKELPPDPLTFKFCLSWATKIDDNSKEYGVDLSDRKEVTDLLSEIFPSSRKEVRENSLMNNGRGYIVINNSLENRLVNYRNTLQGIPAKSEDNFIRMLYLSSITITTVGFGDIVPTSSYTRILVSIEAVLGIILIGLFINSSYNNRK
jgi:hypothetical protein